MAGSGREVASVQVDRREAAVPSDRLDQLGFPSVLLSNGGELPLSLAVVGRLRTLQDTGVASGTHATVRVHTGSLATDERHLKDFNPEGENGQSESYEECAGVRTVLVATQGTDDLKGS